MPGRNARTSKAGVGNVDFARPLIGRRWPVWARLRAQAAKGTTSALTASRHAVPSRRPEGIDLVRRRAASAIAIPTGAWSHLEAARLPHASPRATAIDPAGLFRKRAASSKLEPKQRRTSGLSIPLMKLHSVPYM